VLGYTLTRDTSGDCPFIIDRVFASAGKKLSQYVDLIPLTLSIEDSIFATTTGFHDYSGEPERMKVEMTRFSRKNAAQ